MEPVQIYRSKYIVRPCGDCETRWPHTSPPHIITGRNSKNWPPLWSWLAATARTPAPFIDPADRQCTFSIRAAWSKARRRGHSGLTQRTSAVYAIWWWWWWCNKYKVVLMASFQNGDQWSVCCNRLLTNHRFLIMTSSDRFE